MLEAHIANIVLRVDYDADWGSAYPHRVSITHHDYEEGDFTIATKWCATPQIAKAEFDQTHAFFTRALFFKKLRRRALIVLSGLIAGYLLGRPLFDLIFN